MAKKQTEKKPQQFNCIKEAVDSINEKLPEKKKFTQSKIAELMGVKTPAVAAWYQKRRDPSVRDLHKLSKILGVSVCELINE